MTGIQLEFGRFLGFFFSVGVIPPLHANSAIQVRASAVCIRRGDCPAYHTFRRQNGVSRWLIVPGLSWLLTPFLPSPSSHFLHHHHHHYNPHSTTSLQAVTSNFKIKRLHWKSDKARVVTVLWMSHWAAAKTSILSPVAILLTSHLGHRKRRPGTKNSVTLATKELWLLQRPPRPHFISVTWQLNRDSEIHISSLKSAASLRIEEEKKRWNHSVRLGFHLSSHFRGIVEAVVGNVLAVFVPTGGGQEPSL